MRIRLLLLWAALSAAAQEHAEFLKKLSEVTGFSMIRPVDQKAMRREELKAYFEERIKEVVKPEEIRIEELTLKKFGFVPDDFDLKQSTIDLMAEQAAAFYDYRKKRMVLLDAPDGGAMAEMTLVHELAHALADQHYNLEKFLKKGNSSDDAALARTAVMEGQASYLMSELMARKLGQSLADSPMMVGMMSRMASAGGSGFPVFEKAPLYMRESLVFPYAKGMVFQHEVVMKYGQKGYREVFERAPNTTQEILHPDKYFDRVQPLVPKLAALARTRGWKKQAEGTVGEFDLSILLKQYAEGTETLASRWRGGGYQLWEDRVGRRTVLISSTAWENDAAAREFLGAYRKILNGKLTRAEFSSESESGLAGKSLGGHFRVWRSGAEVASIEGFGMPADVVGPR
jgi:hypothetical protein